MRVPPMSVALVAVVAWCGAAAEESTTGDCRGGPPSFAATEANRVSCREIQDLRRSSSAVVMMRRHARRPNCEFRISRPTTARRDGSFVQFCEIRCQSSREFLGFDWRPCSGEGSSGRTTGVGTCANGVWCGMALGLGREVEGCGAYHRHGDSYAYVWTSGRRSCLEGDVNFVPR